MDHNTRDKNSHLLKHSREKNHQHVWENDFKVLGNNYRSNFKRKISEALFTKQLNCLQSFLFRVHSRKLTPKKKVFESQLPQMSEVI